MKHFPATRGTPRLDGLSLTRAPRAFSLPFLLLVGAVLFAAGFCTAVWTVGVIITAR